jgi:hypothetical protein
LGFKQDIAIHSLFNEFILELQVSEILLSAQGLLWDRAERIAGELTKLARSSAEFLSGHGALICSDLLLIASE